MNHPKYYQELFNLMSNEHGLTLTESEMEEIIIVSLDIIRKMSTESIA